MRIDSKLLLFAITLILSGVAVANGQDKTFQNWDKNGDKQLTREEVPERFRGNFDKVDANKDGVISLEEHRRVMQSGQRNQRNRLPEGVTAHRDLEYVAGGHERQRLDLYLPREAKDGPVPLVVWIHGGAWKGGNKSGGPWRPLLEEGFAVASINYRLTQHAIFPAQIHDCKSAIKFLRTKAEEYHFDADRIGVWGGSAGGHLVAMLGTTGDVAALESPEYKGTSSRVQCVCNWFGVSDLNTIVEQSDETSVIPHAADDSPESLLLGGTIESNPEKAAMASPVHHITQDDAPTISFHGTKDRLVPWQQSEQLHQALQKAGVESELVIIEGAGHGGFGEDYLQMSIEFFKERLGK